MNQLLLSFLMLCTSVLMGQNLEPVKWDFTAEHIEDNRYALIYTASIDKGWNVYSQFIDDGGPVPTTIAYEAMDGASTIGKGEESGYKKEGMDAIFDMNVIKFLDQEPFTIRQEIEVTDPNKPITGYLTFMCCDDERCLPPMDLDFTFDISQVKKKVASAVKAEVEEREAVIASAQSDIQSPEVIQAVSSSIKNTTNQENAAAPSENDYPVQWTIDVKKIEGDEYLISYGADIDKGWTVYSQFIDEGGPIPTSITYENPDDYELVGDAPETGARKEGHDQIFDMNVIKFYDSEPYQITQKIKVNPGTSSIKGYLTFMTCDGSKCLAPKDIDFNLSLAGTSTGAVITNEPSTLASNSEGLTEIDQIRQNLRDTNAAPAADCGEEDTKTSSLPMMFIFGFLGGLFALLTPCVFPMIPMTVSYFTKDTKKKGWVNALIYAASIIVIYVSIGLIITGVFGASALNALSTNWIANTLFFLVFVFFAFSFFGFYEITLPSSWSTKSDQMADKGGWLGIFFMAFTLALVSFSCTGPIIGTALVQSATDKLGPFIVMLGFSSALALPFGLFAAFPAFLNSLPQSGGWMNSVKVVLGFIELALAFKFLSVADLTSHWGFLKYELFLGIWIAIALGMAAYGFGWLKFPHDSPLTKISPRRWVFSIACIALAAYLGSGFMYNDTSKSYAAPGLLSGIAPPSTYNIFLDAPEVDPVIKAKYPSYGKCANDINCFKDYYEGMAYAKEMNKPVLLDHTGHGCVNCRKTEEFIWVNDDVRNTINEDYVLISLYVDDRKALEEVLISKTRQNKIRTVGNKWTDFQIVNFDQISQPLYVMVTPDEEVLAKPRGYKEGIQDYLDYLNCGLSSYRSQSLN